MQTAEKSSILSRLGLTKQGYALLTLHRPSNVDDRQSLTRIMSAIRHIAKRIPVVFPVHPRTQKRLKKFNLLTELPITSHQSRITNHQFLLIDPLGYLDFLNLEMNSRFVITDSGGIQVETTVLGIPCLTMLDFPLWPTTHKQGTNTLVGSNSQKLLQEASRILDGKGKKGKCPRLWDGRAAERIVAVINTETDIRTQSKSESESEPCPHPKST
jgi:UDP-N-acetylglucosamine 2-epimerase (non-hydrolysing)